MIYEDFRKPKVAVFSKRKNVLDALNTKIAKDKCVVKKYMTIDEIIKEINDIKIIVILDYDLEYIKQIKSIEKDIKIIVYNKKIKNRKLLEKLDIEYVSDEYTLNNEILKIITIIQKENEFKFKEQKMKIVSTLIESIAHRVQAHLLMIGATMDVSKLLISYDLKNDGKEKENLINEMYKKNEASLDEANTLLELLSGATSISQESIMTCEDIIKVISLVMDEYLSVNNKSIKYIDRIKKGEYICGPINDLIFVVCNIIDIFLSDGEEISSLEINEDENLWYFEIKSNELISQSTVDKIEKINYLIDYLEINVINTEVILKMYKVKE